VLPDHIRQGKIPREELHAIHVQRHSYSELVVFTVSLLCCIVHIAIKLKQHLVTIFKQILGTSFNQTSPLISNTLTYLFHYMYAKLQVCLCQVSFKTTNELLFIVCVFPW
jgi:hypothetical protein